MLINEKHDQSTINIENLDISGYEKIVLEFNPLSLKENKPIILNPFVNRENETDLQLEKLKDINEYKVKKTYLNSELFSQLIQIVYEDQNDSNKKITEKEIETVYLTLILNVLKLYKQKNINI